MLLWPTQSETIVLPFDAEEVSDRVRLATKETTTAAEQKPDQRFLFNGHVENQGFRISRIINAPDNSLPLIIGKIESTRTGCIVFIQYRLFFAARLFLFFWSLIALLLAFIFLVGKNQWVPAVASILAGMINYWVNLTNFERRIKVCKETLLKVILPSEFNI
jgi:hypothetical protein